MKILKDKIYWLLMPPFLLMGIFIILWLPNEKGALAFIVVPLFWATYGIVKWGMSNRKK